jgi:GT2 family glycosyltransferase
VQDLDLSITICSWNTLKDLDACLRSLEDERATVQFEVIVIENASDDGSPQMVQDKYPWVNLQVQSTNLGFGKGHNLGFGLAKGKVLVALNSDTVVHAGALASMAAFLSENPDIGIAGPKLLNPDGSLQLSCRRFPTPIAALFRNTPFGKLFPKNRFTREYLMSDWAHDEPRDVDWVSGAALFLSRDAYAKIGGFDERFFMFLEDVDICKRAHEAGFRVVYYPKAVITHAIGRSTDLAANAMIRQFHQSMMLYYKKHNLRQMPVLARPFAAIGAGLGLWLRQSVFILKNKRDDYLRRKGRI